MKLVSFSLPLGMRTEGRKSIKCILWKTTGVFDIRGNIYRKTRVAGYIVTAINRAGDNFLAQRKNEPGMTRTRIRRRLRDRRAFSGDARARRPKRHVP
jgi:hypothetical protein